MCYLDHYVDAKIITNEIVAPQVYKMELLGDFKGEPGQFYMLKAWDMHPLLGRPLSICDRTDHSITFLYLVVGIGTDLLRNMKSGAHVKLMGPLGNGFSDYKDKKTAIISGGIGIAPMLYLAKSMNQPPDLYAGFHDTPYFIEEMRPYVNTIKLASDTGGYGVKGNVGHIFEVRDYDAVYACGPNAMFRALKKIVPPNTLYISMESHMACGMGACLGCTVPTVSGMRRVCKEGPVFNAEEVLFDDEN